MANARYWRDVGNDLLLLGIAAEIAIDVLCHDDGSAKKLLNFIPQKTAAVFLAGILVVVGIALERANGNRADIVADKIRDGQQSRIVALDNDLLTEQRLTAKERMTLAAVARATFPRTVANGPQLIAALKGLGPVNIAFVQAREPEWLMTQLVQIFKDAGVLGRVWSLPSDSDQSGVVTYRVDSKGERVAEILWRVSGVGGASVGLLPIGLEKIPKNENCVIVGINDAAFQPMPGQPGEGLDQAGRPLPAPQ